MDNEFEKIPVAKQENENFFLEGIIDKSVMNNIGNAYAKSIIMAQENAKEQNAIESKKIDANIKISELEFKKIREARKDNITSMVFTILLILFVSVLTVFLTHFNVIEKSETRIILIFVIALGLRGINIPTKKR